MRVDIVDGPAETHAARCDRALAYHRSNVRRRPELVLLQVHEANDSPPSLLIISGWESPVPLDPADQVLDEAMRDVVSDGTIRRFVGRALAETMGI